MLVFIKWRHHPPRPLINTDLTVNNREVCHVLGFIHLTLTPLVSDELVVTTCKVWAGHALESCPSE